VLKRWPENTHGGPGCGSSLTLGAADAEANARALGEAVSAIAGELAKANMAATKTDPPKILPMRLNCIFPHSVR
jgi:hypothetical protein